MVRITLKCLVVLLVLCSLASAAAAGNSPAPPLRPAFVGNPLDQVRAFVADLSANIDETKRKIEGTRINILDRFGISHDHGKKEGGGEVKMLAAGRLGAAEKERKLAEARVKHKLSEEEMAKIDDAWKVFDGNSDGVISAHELQKTMETLGHKHTMAEVKTMMQKVDVDGSEGVEYDEFIEMMAPKIAAARVGADQVKIVAGRLDAKEKSKRAQEAIERYNLSEAQMKKIAAAFKEFDQNGDGTISADELQETLLSLGHTHTKAQIRTMMMQVDADGSNCIEYDEFLQMMAPKMNK